MRVVERDVVRAVVLDVEERLLLLHTQDLFHPEVGLWWELPGGGIDPGETYTETIIRELGEETGLAVNPAQVGAPTWRRQASYAWRGERRISNEVVVPVRLPWPAPLLDETGRTAYEKEDYVGYRWWPVPEVVASDCRFYPGRLPGLLTAFLAGEEIDEPFELWS
jgi:8-oxo-dGTP pyrophosphatase MutT (NUDIX family)